MKISSILKHTTVLTDSKSWKSDPSDNEYIRTKSPKYKIKDMSDLSTRENPISFDDLLANIPPVTEPVAKLPTEELPDEASFKGKDRVVPIRHLNIIILITSHWQYRQSHRYKNIDDAIKILGDKFELNFRVIAKIPYDTEFLVADGDNYKTVLIKRRTSRFDVFVTKTLLSPHMKTPNIKYIFRESQGRPVKLGDLVAMSKGMEDADFWIEYRGSANTVGKPSKEYGPHKLGIKVTATDKLDPKYLYYVFMHLHNQGQFAKMAHGTTNLVNIKISDLANIPLAMSESIVENDDEPVRITLRGFPKSPDDRTEPTPAKKWIDHLYATLPKNPLNPDQLALVYGEGADQQIALFELEPVKVDPKTVYVKWFQAYPMRQGVGTRAMKELQDMAGKAGLKLNLISWNHGKVPRRALDKFYKKAGFKPSSGKLGGLTWDPLSEGDTVTFAGKDPREFTSPNGGKAAMVIVTAQGSRYLITDDGMVLRYKSAHANTGGEDQGLKNWSQRIEFYDPAEKVGGTTFPLAVSAAVSKNLPVALSTASDGRRVLAILDNGKWRAAKISDVFKHVATDDATIVGNYSTTPKLHWNTMDYDINSKGMLSRVHPGSPVSHGAAIKHTVTENDYNERWKQIRDQQKQKAVDAFKLGAANGLNTLDFYNLNVDDVPGARESLDLHKRQFIKRMLDLLQSADGINVGLARNTAYKLQGVGIQWPDLDIIIDAGNNYFNDDDLSRNNEIDELDEAATPEQLNKMTTYITSLCERQTGFHVNFQTHFINRINDERNEGEITAVEVKNALKEFLRIWRNLLPATRKDTEVVIHDVGNDIWIPLYIDVTKSVKELTPKTIYKKKNFETSNDVVRVNEVLKESITEGKVKPSAKDLKLADALEDYANKHISEREPGFGDFMYHAELIRKGHKDIHKQDLTTVQQRYRKTMNDMIKQHLDETRISEGLTYKDPVAKWIAVFKASTHPKFKGKTAEQREKMARMAQYKAVQNKKPFTESALLGKITPTDAADRVRDGEISEITIDNKKGWGAVPFNQNVDYRGLRVAVTPKMFLKLALTLDVPLSASSIEQHIRLNGAIAAPFLMISIPRDWFEGDMSQPAEIRGHEGRNRMHAVLGTEGNIPVETHLFFDSEVRNRHLTPAIIDRLNQDIISQQGKLVKGPWFGSNNLLESKKRRAKTLIDGMIKSLIKQGRTHDEAVADLKRQVDARFYEHIDAIAAMITEQASKIDSANEQRGR